MTDKLEKAVNDSARFKWLLQSKEGQSLVDHLVSQACRHNSIWDHDGTDEDFTLLIVRNYIDSRMK